MSVRAVLARPRGTDPTRFEGVYLHNAGRPDELGPVLWTLMRDRYRFDAAGFSREMIDDNLAGWSNIDCLGGQVAKTWDGTTKLTVEQHQANFNADIEDAGPTSFQNDASREVPGITTPPIDDTSDNWGADLVYVVGAAGLSILVPDDAGGPYVLVATLPWGEEPDWEAVDEQLGDAWGQGEEDDGEDNDDEDEDDEHDDPVVDGYAAHETQDSNAVVATSFEQVKQGKILLAQKALLAYLSKGGPKTPAVLTNLFMTLGPHPLPPAELTPLLDGTLAAMAQMSALLTEGLIENLCIVLNNLGRGAESLRLCELALARNRRINANCYVGLTYGAYVSQDLSVMRRALEHVEHAMAEQPRLLPENPAVFDNVASMYVALGDKAKALEYVALCKKHRYENFAAMPSMPDYASLKNDPEFKKLFTGP